MTVKVCSWRKAANLPVQRPVKLGFVTSGSTNCSARFCSGEFGPQSANQYLWRG